MIFSLIHPPSFLATLLPEVHLHVICHTSYHPSCWSFSKCFLPKILYPLSATCPAQWSIMYFTLPFYLIFFRYKCIPCHFILNTCVINSSVKVTDRVLHPYKTTNKIVLIPWTLALWNSQDGNIYETLIDCFRICAYFDCILNIIDCKPHIPKRFKKPLCCKKSTYPGVRIWPPTTL
jgi:hypothetical protein